MMYCILAALAVASSIGWWCSSERAKILERQLQRIKLKQEETLELYRDARDHANAADAVVREQNAEISRGNTFIKDVVKAVESHNERMKYR